MLFFDVVAVFEHGSFFGGVFLQSGAYFKHDLILQGKIPEGESAREEENIVRTYEIMGEIGAGDDIAFFFLVAGRTANDEEEEGFICQVRSLFL